LREEAQRGKKLRRSTMMHSPARLVRDALLWLELLLFLSIPGITWAAIMATLESPDNGQAVSGIAIIRGWAFDTQAGVQISSVELFIDGVRGGNIPCCSERGDVQAAFPEFPAENTLNSGWGATFNWGILSSGMHTVRVEIESIAGGFFSTDTRTVTVVRPGDFEFLSQFDPTNATVSLSSSSIVVNGIQVTDQITGQSKTINATFGWSQSSQALVMTSATTVGIVDGGNGDGNGFAVRLLAPPDGANEELTVTFQWEIENAKPNAVYCSEVITDKGQEPRDGVFEDLFSAGPNTQLTVNLPPSRYDPASFEWAVCVTACDDPGAVCADTTSFRSRSGEPGAGSLDCSEVRFLHTSG
jgi:hypothetical protein